MPLFAVREHDEVYHLEVDIKMKIFSFLRNALQTTKKTEKKSVSYKITLPLCNITYTQNTDQTTRICCIIAENGYLALG